MSEAVKIPSLKKDFLLKLKARLEQKKRDIKVITSPDSNLSDNKPEQESQQKQEGEGCSRDSVGHENDKDTHIADETSNSNPLDSTSDSGLHGNCQPITTIESESEIKSEKEAELELSKENEGCKRKSSVSSSSESESSETENIIERKNKKTKIPRRSSSNSNVFSKSKLENFDTTSSNTKTEVVSPASSLVSSARRYSELDDDHSRNDEDANKISKHKRQNGKENGDESLDPADDKHTLQEIHGYLICCIMLTSLLESQSVVIDAQTFKMLKAMQSELGQAISVFFMKDLGSKSKLVEEIAEEMFDVLTRDEGNDDGGLFQVFGIDLTQRHCSEALCIVFNSNPADPSMLHRLRAQGSFQYLQDIHTIYKTGFVKGK